MWREMMAAGVVMGMLAGAAMAQSSATQSTRIVGGVVTVPYQENEVRSVIVLRSISEPAAVVSRALSEQPTRPWLIEVRRAGGTPIFLDPQENYERQGPNAIDENNSILRAQRQGVALRTPSVQIVRGNLNGSRVITGPQPYMILEKPDQSPDMPSVPASKSEKGKLMVKAD